MNSLRSSAAIVALAGALGAPVILRAQSGFEGVISVSMAAGGRTPTVMQIAVKDKLTRLDMNMGGMIDLYVLSDPAKSTTSVVIPMRQMFMEQPAAQAATAVNSVAGKGSFKMTAKKDTIAGYECEHATITDETGSAIDACLAKGLGSLTLPGMSGMMGGRGGQQAQPSWQTALTPGTFPLKVQRSNGEVLLEVIKIEKKSLDAALFTIPDGFQKMSMPGGGW